MAPYGCHEIPRFSDSHTLTFLEFFKGVAHCNTDLHLPRGAQATLVIIRFEHTHTHTHTHTRTHTHTHTVIHLTKRPPNKNR
jgi:hypothetical protein